MLRCDLVHVKYFGYEYVGIPAECRDLLGNFACTVGIDRYAPESQEATYKRKGFQVFETRTTLRLHDLATPIFVRLASLKITQSPGGFRKNLTK
jgi:hypothetical protein